MEDCKKCGNSIDKRNKNSFLYNSLLCFSCFEVNRAKFIQKITNKESKI